MSGETTAVNISGALFNDETQLTDYGGKVWRMVETQETAATLKLVDSMEEQGVLEQLLDAVKPPYRQGTEGMHYLLKTAFRYPPLQYGSRFGTRLMPSFFYASEERETALAETAYYRFIFLHDMDDTYEQGFDSNHSLFSVSLKSTRCLDLCSASYHSIAPTVSDPRGYAYCHAVGEWAVNQASADLIRYPSARRKDSVNVAVANPSSIRSKAPNARQSWLCRTTPQKISFSSRDARFPHTFFLEQFLIDGELPRPA